MGDFGTLFPLAIGLIAVCGMDPAALFLMMGLSNVVTGIIYRLPMPVEPKKVVSVVAIAQRWSATTVSAAGLGLGVVWFVVAASGLLRWLVKVTPTYIVRGIQLALGITLAATAIEMMRSEPWLGVLAIVIIVLLRRNRYAPAAVVIVSLGIAIMASRGDLRGPLSFGITLPSFSLPAWGDVRESMVLAGFAQIPLTITNAVLATATMIRDYFPEKPVSERRLMLNMSVMNVASALFGGMPLCHGSGGLAGQYYFGARTGGANILEGLIEIGLGVFLGRSLLGVLTAFPLALLGGMMLMVGLQFVRPVLGLRGRPLALALLTTMVSILTNMGLGFVAGIAAATVVRLLVRLGALRATTDDG